jgi:hypothetical protein
MSKIRILIAEDNIEWTNFYKKLFGQIFEANIKKRPVPEKVSRRIRQM